ncbi:hypothetical protein Tco_0074162, partial [Tanacetum coccineum]
VSLMTADPDAVTNPSDVVAISSRRRHRFS